MKIGSGRRGCRDQSDGGPGIPPRRYCKLLGADNVIFESPTVMIKYSVIHNSWGNTYLQQ